MLRSAANPVSDLADAWADPPVARRPLANPAESSVSASRLRLALRCIRPGPVVITSHGDDGPIGFTAASFEGLSARPALVMFAPRRTSLSWPQIRRVQHFCINVPPSGDPHLVRQFGPRSTDRFHEQEWTTSPNGSPLLAGADWWLDCTVWAEHDAGDHRLVMAQVQDLGSVANRLDPSLFTADDTDYPQDDPNVGRCRLTRAGTSVPGSARLEPDEWRSSSST